VLFSLLENCVLLAIRVVVNAMKQADAERNVGGSCNRWSRNAIRARRKSNDFSEQCAERPQALKTNRNTYLSDRQVGGSQKVFCFRNTLLYQILMGCLFVDAPKHPNEVIGGKRCLTTDSLDCDRHIVMPIHKSSCKANRVAGVHRFAAHRTRRLALIRQVHAPQVDDVAGLKQAPRAKRDLVAVHINRAVFLERLDVMLALFRHHTSVRA
jgi:hypothetical protein